MCLRLLGQPDPVCNANVTNQYLPFDGGNRSPISSASMGAVTHTLVYRYNILNGVEILPDSSTAHWTVDTQQQTTISPGQTLRPFYVTDW